MKSIKQINRILAPYGIEIVKGAGYFYFVSEGMDIPSIICNSVNQINQNDLDNAIEVNKKWNIKF